ncbi:hypothetical protein Tel_12005 [Candidatus Tenderia electrophaga]|jgi:hypothetical protein|uniref:Alginate export domain-containing protein n=1 Tax=Candidatus Tenderia electrophaga TaxID=1748243 RepID=A0A0S2TFC4_9GAMM|nr:hypothetical protein Tel_12005 [Candidatus Tenderia electrophaga]
MKRINVLGIETKAPATLLLAAALAGGNTTTASAAGFTDAVAGGEAGLELRYRYEIVDQTGISEKAKASTLRTRLNYASADYKGFNAFLEFDDITAFGDIEYNNATGLPSAQTSYPVIADPEGTEVNQAKLSYTGLADTGIMYGRQRIILDNARFIGNVGWRQNEQTYDAFTVNNSTLADTQFLYSYVSNVNRIFGEAAAAGDLDTKAHLLNIAYSGFGAGKLTGYGYFLELVDNPSASQATLGLRFAGDTPVSQEVKALYTLEFAQQSDYADGAATIDADYSLVEVGAAVSGVTVKLGLETLGGDGTYAFSTPLATLHAFNGWADKFLATPVNGLVDTYVSVSGKLSGVKLMGVYHDFSADTGGGDYGTELDLLAAKTFGNYTVLAKYAAYSADSFATDTDKMWLMGQATF